MEINGPIRIQLCENQEPNNKEWKTLESSVQEKKKGRPKGRQWRDILQVLKEKGCRPQILHQTKLSFKNKDEIKAFPEKQKIRACVSLETPLKRDSYANCDAQQMVTHL